MSKKERDEFQRGRESMHSEIESLRALARRAGEALKKAHQEVEALKLPCPMDPEAPQSIRNGAYASIALNIHEALSDLRAAGILEGE